MRAALLLAALTLSAHAQWILQQSNTTADLRGIDNVGHGIAWASGTNGTVLHTTDNGATWLLCKTPPNAEHLDFRGIQAFDADTAIVMSSGKGDLSRLYRTKDGCQTWSLLFTNPDGNDGFFDALQLSPASGLIGGYLAGDPVNETFPLWFIVPDYKSPANAKESLIARTGESAFAASNTALFVYSETFWFGTGGAGGARVIRKVVHGGDGIGWVSYPSSDAPVGQHTESSGIFGLAFDVIESKHSYSIKHGIAVGGDYLKPDDPTHTAAFTANGGRTWQAAATPPHGYRSAVAYDASTKTWITVGPNGTDISTDDGRNWRALKPSPADAPDADQHWNALSLPFVVGPHGRIGVLRSDALSANGASRGCSLRSTLYPLHSASMLLYAATSNPGKLAEFTTAAATSGVEVLALPGIQTMPEPVEDAATFRGNAEIKALAYSRLAPGLLVMADDSGLEVEALGGQPGVRSARFADDMGFELNSPIGKDTRNNRCILSLLAALPNPTRAARFTCELAVARDGRILHNARGKVDGVLLTAPRGADGFGYDPLFLVPRLGLTFAEIPREQKWQLSHRGTAFRSLLTQLSSSTL